MGSISHLTPHILPDLSASITWLFPKFLLTLWSFPDSRFAHSPLRMLLRETNSMKKPKSSIKASRVLSQKVDLWKMSPAMDLLSEREENEAYVTAEEGRHYALYFTNGGSVILNLKDDPGEYSVMHISIASAEETDGGMVTGGSQIQIKAPGDGGWYVVLKNNAF